ncbi:glycosyltransferase family 2 protein [Ferrimonas senticii]|uniref:glycosyltransferase family 2 protein n=1 Tax=Ferrimonas senticii TaxID=394566 RepID=UPI000426E10D|nr:glycosyltransferase family 2 protein [Ferrimonas senticii]
MKLCVLIPHFNHSQQLAAVLPRLAAYQLPCVVIDDGSSEHEQNRLKLLLAAYPTVTLVQRPYNGGKGAAVKTGLRWCYQQGFSHALQLDADGQHDLADIPALIATANANPTAMITGVPQYDDSVPTHRYLARYLTHFWVWVETLSLELQDTMCGFRVYPLASTVTLLQQQPIGDRMDFDTEIMVRQFWQQVPIIQRPTAVIYPEQGRSHFRAVQDNWLISKMHTKLVFGMLARLPTLLRQRHRSPRHWSRTNERGALWGLKAVLWLYGHGGRLLCHAVMPLLISYFYLTGREARTASWQYLAKVRAIDPNHPQLSGDANHFDSYRHFLRFGYATLAKLDAWSGHQTTNNAQFPNRQQLIDQLESGQGAMIITAHLGNIEQFRASAQSRYRRRITVLALTRHAAKFNQIMAELNPESQLELLQVDDLGPDSAMLLQQRIDQGELVFVAGDRTSAGNQSRAHYANFLGHPAPFSIGPYVLAAVLNCPIYIMLAGCDHRGQPLLHLEQLTDRIGGPRQQRQQQINDCIERYAQSLQTQTLQQPLNWFNFYDFWQPVTAPVTTRPCKEAS